MEKLGDGTGACKWREAFGNISAKALWFRRVGECGDRLFGMQYHPLRSTLKIFMSIAAYLLFSAFHLLPRAPR